MTKSIDEIVDFFEKFGDPSVREIPGASEIVTLTVGDFFLEGTIRRMGGAGKMYVVEVADPTSTDRIGIGCADDVEGAFELAQSNLIGVLDEERRELNRKCEELEEL